MGEPLLNREFFGMVREAVSFGIAVEVTTNATLLNEENCRRLLDSGLVTIFLSVDEATLETFERTHGGAKTPRIVERIHRVTASHGRRKLPGVRCWIVGQASNIQEVSAWVHLAKDLGVDCARLQYDLICWAQEAWQAGPQADSPWTSSQHPTAGAVMAGGRSLARQLDIGIHVHTDNKFF